MLSMANMGTNPEKCSLLRIHSTPNFKAPGQIVRPLIKKSTLDKNILKNYRPVSNLSFISKITEKIVASRFKKHLLENSLHEPKQSAYRSHHSTDTALISVTNDIMCAVDQKKAVMLVLLDLSAAFDTIDHSILLNRLHKRYGITGTALSWFDTYLTDRCQIIQLNGERCGSNLVFHKGRCWALSYLLHILLIC